MNRSSVIKKISYSVFANLVSLLVSVCMVLIVPKFLAVEDYGVWQLFLFYFSYLGFFHFGWLDGIYLRYAGNDFNELDPKLFSGQYYLLIIFQALLGVLIILFANLFVTDPIKSNVLYCVAPLLVVVNFYTACNQLMQFTNRIEEYAKLMLTERIVLLVSISMVIFLGYRHFIDLYFSKVLSLLVVFILCIYLCRRLLVLKFYSFNSIINEAKTNISVGIKLMFANIASMILIGIIRYGISLGWDVSTFGRISLTLNISNFLMVFISAVSVVLFPILKRMDSKKLPSLYCNLRDLLSFVLLAAMIAYFPLKSILSWWLPKYADSLIYMAVLFPVCLFESKVTLLINTYLKSMRQEFLMLKINVAAVLVGIVITIISVKILHSLNLAVFSIVFVYAIRCFIAEYKLQRLLHINLRKDQLEEFILVLIFMATGWLLNNWGTTAIYLTAYIAYAFVNKSKISNMMNLIRNKNA